MNHYLRPVCAFLALAILFQGCAIYGRESVSLDQAAKTHHKVLMIRNNDQKVKLKQIERADSVYYGIARTHGRKVKILLDKNDIKMLRPINRTATTFANVGLIASGAIVFAAIIFAATWKWDDVNSEPINF